MIRRIIPAFFVFIGLYTSSIQAQYTPQIGTARPGNTVGAGTVGRNILQFQNGYAFYDMRLEQAQVREEAINGQLVYDSVYGRQTHQLNNVIRYGLFERFEVRARVNYTGRTLLAEGNSFYARAGYSNLMGVDIGLRTNLIHKPESGVDFAVQADAGYDFDTKDLEGAAFKGSLFLLHSKAFTQHFILTTNLGFSYSEINPDRLLARISLRYLLKDLLFQSGFNYERMLSLQTTDNNYESGYFLGFGYFLTNDIALDLEGSYRVVLTGEFIEDDRRLFQNTWAFTTGISWRLNYRE